MTTSTELSNFVNEPLLELRRTSERERLLVALAELDERLPLSVPVLAGSAERDDPSLESVDPSDPQRLVARVTCATEAEVDAAVRTAGEAFADWAALEPQERAAILIRAAGDLRSNRHALAALQVRECAKPWDQADGDVCEAIDFLEYYARAAVELANGTPLVQLPGERNTIYYRPRGVVAVVAPWNFPMAIATGMTAAALATGNTVCLKPAEQSPACAFEVVAALRRAGVPEGALSLLPGEGEVGAALVAHPGVHTIAFTGSHAVGMEILKVAAVPGEGQHHLKRVVAEMGGKNCVIVDADADLDEVVPALLDSAFAFAGQKCSAASRVLVHERVAPALTERLRGALATLRTGPAEDFATDVPSVIDEDSRRRIQGALADLPADVEVHRAPPSGSPEGYYVEPAIVSGAGAASSVVAEELFGPVLSVESVRDVDAACDLVDLQAQALTGGLFSRNPRVIARVVRRTPVGNLYVNRGTTGAMVGRQPFGGNRLSGTGTKAGGPDYLMHFVEPVVVTENTVRHGLPI